MKLIQISSILLLSSALACHKPTDSVIPSDPFTQVDSLTATPTAIGKPIGAPITKTIGPTGGTMVTPDGKLSLTFPAGAVKQATAITVQAGENKAPNGVGQAFTITPTMTFDQGITVIYHYQNEEMNNASVEAIGMASQDGRQAWQLSRPATVDKTKKTVTANVKQAKWWGLVTEYLLTPEKDTVVVGDSRELLLTYLLPGNHFPDWATNASQADIGKEVVETAWLVQPVAANSAVDKVYINGIDWTGAAPKDQSWGGVGYNPQTAQILYVAPSRKPTNNAVMVSVQIKHPGSNAQFLLSSELTILADNSFMINGHSFTNVIPNGSLINGHLTVTAVGVDSAGESGSISLFLNSLSIGAHPFSDEIDITKGTSINVLDGTGKGDNIEGSSFYSTCTEPKTESGTIQVVKVERTNGTAKITLQISGNVVTKHSYNAETCTVSEHKTMPVSGRLTVVARE